MKIAIHDAEGIPACSRWLSAATPPDRRTPRFRTPAGVPARRRINRQPRWHASGVHSVSTYDPAVALVPHSTTGYKLTSLRDGNLPPLATQQAITAEIAEQALVAANRELITRFEQKIQSTFARI